MGNGHAQDSGGYTGEGCVEIIDAPIILLFFLINAAIRRGILHRADRGRLGQQIPPLS